MTHQNRNFVWVLLKREDIHGVYATLEAAKKEAAHHQDDIQWKPANEEGDVIAGTFGDWTCCPFDFTPEGGHPAWAEHPVWERKYTSPSTKSND